jgi:hypothetical protein
MYREVRAHESTATLFKKQLVATGEFSHDEVDAIERQCQESLDAELQELEVAQASGDQDALRAGQSEAQPPYSHEPVPTGIPIENLRDLGVRLAKPPKNFEVNEKIAKRFLESRRKAAENGGPYNWAFAEALAFGSLIEEGRPVRLSGQDCRRGTFSQRHAVIYDAITRKRYTPLNHLQPDQPAKLWVYNSLLSEFAVLAFEYGYSVQDPESLVLWEAQFGDFANGAQVIIDQFISSAESKWQRPSHLVLLLPHGYEGQGPEHSSARLERFLQLCAEQNMRICNLTKPSQYFHALRRQIHSPIRKPLVLMTPKSLLNHEGCTSTDVEFAEGTSFREVLDDEMLPTDDPERIERLVFCTGKVYFDLIDYRAKHEIKNTAIIRIEQIYPFHEEMVREITSRYPNSHAKWVWCQEEPLNMGAWTFIGPRLEQVTDHRVRYAGRDRASSPAAGAKAIHVRQQAALIESAAAMLTTYNEVDMSGIMDLRNEYKDAFEKKHGVKLGFMSFFVKACCPRAEGSPRGQRRDRRQDVVYKNYVHMGVAVGTPSGLVVPVVRDADQMGFAAIEKKIAELGLRARDGKLSMAEMQGGSFTISNGGVYGSLMSSPILNPRSRHPRHAQDPGPPGGGERPDRHPPDDVSRAELRPPHRRRQGRGDVPCAGERGAGGPARRAGCFSG